MTPLKCLIPYLIGGILLFLVVLGLLASINKNLEKKHAPSPTPTVTVEKGKP